MEMILKFNLPEEQEEAERARKAADAFIVLFDYDQYLRGRLKYEELSEEVDEALRAARGKLRELLTERGIGEHI